MSRTVGIIQARLSSSRLPGKVLLDLCGKPMLQWVFERTSRAASIDTVLVATTSDPTDNELAAFCKAHGMPCLRGSQFDVLDRFHRAALSVNASTIVRITADCPLIDPTLIDETVGLLGTGPTGARFDFAANRLPPPWPRTYPIGLDVEVCTWEALEKAWRDSASPAEREHVMPYIYKGVHVTPAGKRLSTGQSTTGFRIAVMQCEEDLGAYRWTVDAEEDLNLVRAIFGRLPSDALFGWQDVWGIVSSDPALLKLNSSVRHKTASDVDPRGP